MERKDFLRGLGLAGVGSMLPFAGVLKAATTDSKPTGTCVLIPTETTGPFPLDLTANTTYFRQDIRETKTGVQLNLKIKITGVNNCLPMTNLRVNIWHCDKDGLYSGYDTSTNAGQAGLTYLRGYQMTDANGEVDFVTIFPGWYSGRICHIHFQVYVSSGYAAISQMSFDVNTKNAIYAANSTLYTKGADPMTFAADNIFSDGYAYQMATLTPNSTTGSYDAYIEATIQGTGTTSVLELETAKQLELGQNYPNPYADKTTIPFTLAKTSGVQVEIWDLSGRKVAGVDKGSLSAGDHTAELDMGTLGLANGTYVYQLVVQNADGLFRTCKVMTGIK